MTHEYLVESKWVGWFGGYGSESDIAERLNLRAAEGWRLVRTETSHFGWYIVVPRVKLLMVFERPRAA